MTEIRFSSRHAVELYDPPMPDIDVDPVFSGLFAQARPHSMTGKDALYALYQAVRHVAAHAVPGDFVECGVWRGGSALLAGLALRRFDPPEVQRRLWLYDTFQGMTAPTAADVDLHGDTAQGFIDRHGDTAQGFIDRHADDGRWCYAPQDAVAATLRAHGLTDANTRFVPGDVVQILAHTVPDRISILRLDTDWYESTRAELETLYSLLSPGGVVIIDDYGHWAGARRATDEYFASRPAPLLHRVNYTVRMGIKV